MRWAAAVQRELLKVDWPDGVLEWAECAPETGEDGRLLWRGLRVKVGMAVGHDAAKRPLNTGEAQTLLSELLGPSQAFETVLACSEPPHAQLSGFLPALRAVEPVMFRCFVVLWRCLLVLLC